MNEPLQWSTIWTQTVHNYFKAIVSSVPKIKYCRIEVIIWRRKLAFTTVTLAKYFLYLKEDREDEPERQLVSQRHDCKPQDRRQKQRKKPEECAENLIKQCDAIKDYGKKEYTSNLVIFLKRYCMDIFFICKQFYYLCDVE